MPPMTFEFRERQRNRPIGDRIGIFRLQGDNFESYQIEDEPIDSPRFSLNPRRDNYTLTVRAPGFKVYKRRVPITSQTDRVYQVELLHRCIELPDFNQLNSEQQRLIGSSTTGSPADLWNGLSTNQATSFFQVSHAASQLRLANNRTLSSYIDSIYRFGGAKIVSDLPDGNRERERTGWRQHIVIKTGDRGGIEADLEQGGIFGPREGFVHPTHKDYGFTRSHREQGSQPSIQIVLNEANSHADLDLDAGAWHRSAPHVVFDRFSQRFPATGSIYRF